MLLRIITQVDFNKGQVLNKLVPFEITKKIVAKTYLEMRTDESPLNLFNRNFNFFRFFEEKFSNFELPSLALATIAPSSILSSSSLEEERIASIENRKLFYINKIRNNLKQVFLFKGFVDFFVPEDLREEIFKIFDIPDAFLPDAAAPAAAAAAPVVTEAAVPPAPSLALVVFVPKTTDFTLVTLEKDFVYINPPMSRFFN